MTKNLKGSPRRGFNSYMLNIDKKFLNKQIKFLDDLSSFFAENNNLLEGIIELLSVIRDHNGGSK